MNLVLTPKILHLTKSDFFRSAIDEHVDSVEGEESGAMTETRLKKLVLNFEKRATKNQELRIKFPDEPVKFLNSEVELHDAVQELRVIATGKYSHLSTFLTNWKKCDSSMFFQHQTITRTLWPWAASSRC